MPSQSSSSGGQESSDGHDLSVTALYTSYTWYWAGFSQSELFVNDESKAVFRVTNWALAIARMFMWNLRPLRHGLAHRHAMIDHLVERENPDVVLELAAGLSRRGVSMSENENLTYIEVDLPHVMARKMALLESKGVSDRVMARPNLKWVSEDVNTLNFQTFLIEAKRPTVISEGLVMYLDAPEQGRLWNRIARALAAEGGGVYLFDFVPTSEQPRPGVIGRILEWLMKKFTKGQAFERDARTRQDIRAQLLEAGFMHVEWFEPHVIAEAWSLPHPTVKTQQLVFRCTVGSESSSTAVEALSDQR